MLTKEDRLEIAHLMQVIVDADVTPKLNLILDELSILREIKVSREELEDQTETLDVRTFALEAAVRQLARDVAELKPAK